MLFQKKIRKNKDVVAYRLNRLASNNIIKSYVPVIDMFKMGFITSRIYLDVEEMEVA